MSDNTFDAVHKWAASWLAPDPDKNDEGDQSSSGSSSDSDSTFDRIHTWAANILAPDAATLVCKQNKGW